MWRRAGRRRHLSLGESILGFRVLDLFSGIGGFSLGLERTGGFRTVAFCEIDKFCQRVLRKHWPEVPIYDDIRELTAARLAADGVVPDVLCGGFPCQDISAAGEGAGIDGERSGLWKEYSRLIGELRPRYIIVENVAALLYRGLDRVLGDLAALGFDAEWHCIPASAVGANHRRDRLWLVAYPHCNRLDDERNGARGNERSSLTPAIALCQSGIRPGRATNVADAARIQPGRSEQRAERERTGASSESRSLAHTEDDRAGRRQQQSESGKGARDVADAAFLGRAEDVNAVPRPSLGGTLARQLAGRDPVGDGQWLTEPDVGRVAHGIPSRVDRLRSLGNAVVPQIPELIGRAILAAEAA